MYSYPQAVTAIHSYYVLCRGRIFSSPRQRVISTYACKTCDYLSIHLRSSMRSETWVMLLGLHFPRQSARVSVFTARVCSTS